MQDSPAGHNMMFNKNDIWPLYSVPRTQNKMDYETSSGLWNINHQLVCLIFKSENAGLTLPSQFWWWYVNIIETNNSNQHDRSLPEVTWVSITVIFILKINLSCTHEASAKQTQRFNKSGGLLAGTCCYLHVLMDDCMCVSVKVSWSGSKSDFNTEGCSAMKTRQGLNLLITHGFVFNQSSFL